MVILQGATKTIQNVFFFVFLKKNKIQFLFKKQKVGFKKTGGLLFFLNKQVFHNPDCLSILLWLSLDRTIW